MRGDGHRQARRRADQRLPDPAGKLANMRVETGFLHPAKRMDEAQHGAQQTYQRRKLRNRREQAQFPLQPRHFCRAGFLQRLAHALPALVTIHDGSLDQPCDGPGRGVANGQRLDQVVALQDGADAVEEFGRVDLRAVAMQKPLDEHRHRYRADDQEQPQHRAAVGQHYRQR